MAESLQQGKYQIVLASSCRPALEALAIEHGFTWGERGNVKAFLEAIAHKEVVVFSSSNVPLKLSPWNESRQQTLLKLVWMLRDAGDYLAVNELAAILLERPELNAPIRAQLELYQSATSTDWKSKIQLLIDAGQPFGLQCADAVGEVATYHVRYATIVPRERHQYLDAWIESPDNSREIPQLAHNRSFRFDRITSAGVAPLAGDWRNEGLDTIEVKFELTGRLAHAYEPRANDTSDSWADRQQELVRVITRKITNTFWFIREMLPYGSGCVIISPKPVRDRFINELHTALDNYRIVE